MFKNISPETTLKNNDLVSKLNVFLLQVIYKVAIILMLSKST